MTRSGRRRSKVGISEKDARELAASRGIDVSRMTKDETGRKTIKVGSRSVSWHRSHGGIGCWKVDGETRPIGYVGQAIARAVELETAP